MRVQVIICVCVCIYMCVCMCIYIYMCVCVCIYVYIYIYVYTHTHTNHAPQVDPCGPSSMLIHMSMLRRLTPLNISNKKNSMLLLVVCVCVCVGVGGVVLCRCACVCDLLILSQVDPCGPSPVLIHMPLLRWLTPDWLNISYKKVLPPCAQLLWCELYIMKVLPRKKQTHAPQVDPCGPSPVLIHLPMLRRLTPDWLNISYKKVLPPCAQLLWCELYIMKGLPRKEQTHAPQVDPCGPSPVLIHLPMLRRLTPDWLKISYTKSILLV